MWRRRQVEHDKWCRRRCGCGRSDQLQAWSHFRGPCLLWGGRGGAYVRKGICCISHMRETVHSVARVKLPRSGEMKGQELKKSSGLVPPPSPRPSPHSSLPPPPPMRSVPRRPTPPAFNTPFTPQQLLAFRTFNSTLVRGS